jgi:hypothetical protein
MATKMKGQLERDARAGRQRCLSGFWSSSLRHGPSIPTPVAAQLGDVMWPNLCLCLWRGRVALPSILHAASRWYYQNVNRTHRNFTASCTRRMHAGDCSAPAHTAGAPGFQITRQHLSSSMHVCKSARSSICNVCAVCTGSSLFEW